MSPGYSARSHLVVYVATALVTVALTAALAVFTVATWVARTVSPRPTQT